MRLDWTAAGERFFESGIDRGVLYINGSGFAWPGLISVAESPVGGGPQPFYIDGIKYVNLAAAEEFSATINAYFSPAEFNPCDGTVSVSNGLFATQQPRSQFDLSYRTKVGNDTDGSDHAYKIHLVYAALAAPSNRTNASLGGSATSASSYSWQITTLPPLGAGVKPTSHFIVDSRLTPTDTLASIEDILYGSSSAMARIPSVQELVSLFNG